MNRHCALGLAFGLAAGLALAAPARAGIDTDLGPDFRGADDTRLFLTVLARHHDHDPADVARLAVRVPDPDELATLLFLATRAARPADAVLALRARGLSWWEIGNRLGLPIEIWFPPVPYDPGPPFNRPYAAWRRLRETHEPFPGLDDSQARDLVAVRLLSDYFGAPVETAMVWRAGGRDARLLAAAEYRRRHGAGPGPASGRELSVLSHDPLRHSLGERVKELTALHRTARLLQDTARPTAGLMREIATFLPDAWQYPGITGARLRLPDGEYATEGFRETPWVQRAEFVVHDGVATCPPREPRGLLPGGAPSRGRGPVPAAKNATSSIRWPRCCAPTCSIGSTIGRRCRARDQLERQVASAPPSCKPRTRPASGDRRAPARLRGDRTPPRQLRRLAAELALAEERERRAIATDLHDHLGQALAFVKLRLSRSSRATPSSAASKSSSRRSCGWSTRRFATRAR